MAELTFFVIFVLGCCIVFFLADPFVPSASAQESEAQKIKHARINFEKRRLVSCQAGRRYLRGDGVVADYNAAHEHLNDAASNGHAKALFLLGSMYRDGLGVQVNNILAHKWFNLATARSVSSDREEASKARQKVEQQLTPDEIIEAQRLAREWDEAHPRD